MRRTHFYRPLRLAAAALTAVFACAMLSGCSEKAPEHLRFGYQVYDISAKSLDLVNNGDLTQLRFAKNLRELSVLMELDRDEGWNWLGCIDPVEDLSITIANGDSPDIDLAPISAGQLKRLIINCECPVGLVSLPQLSAIETVEIYFAGGFERLDLSGCGSSADLLISLASGSAGTVTLPLTAGRIEASGFPVDLSQASGAEELALDRAVDLSPLTGSSVTRLGLYGGGWDLSPLAGGNVDTLWTDSLGAREFASLAGARNIKTLKINGSVVDDISFTGLLPSLELLIVAVSDVQPGEIMAVQGMILTSADLNIIGFLDSSIPAGQLADYLESGGSLYIDAERTV